MQQQDYRPENPERDECHPKTLKHVRRAEPYKQKQRQEGDNGMNDSQTAQHPVTAGVGSSVCDHGDAGGLTRHKISCREPSVHGAHHTRPTADSPSVNGRLARGQLHRLVRCSVVNLILTHVDLQKLTGGLHKLLRRQPHSDDVLVDVREIA